MLRPNSIIMFERLYLASLAIVLLQQIGGFFVAQSIFARMPAGADLPGMNGVFSGLMVGSMIFGLLFAIGIPLLLWWLAARNRTEVAKWLLLVVSILSVLMWLFGLIVALTMPMPDLDSFQDFRTMQLALVAVDGVAEVLGIVALVYLFRADATEWFRTGAGPANADVFR